MSPTGPRHQTYYGTGQWPLTGQSHHGWPGIGSCQVGPASRHRTWREPRPPPAPSRRRVGRLILSDQDSPLAVDGQTTYHCTPSRSPNWPSPPPSARPYPPPHRPQSRGPNSRTTAPRDAAPCGVGPPFVPNRRPWYPRCAPEYGLKYGVDQGA